MALHIVSPLVESRPLSLACGRQVWLKQEAMQPAGSFKIRGIGLACEIYAAEGKRRFICSSGGNAGIAVAYSGRCLSIPVVVVVPETTTESAKDIIRRENAEVIVHGVSWQEANALAVSMVTDEDAFLHPFDNPILWRGHATLIDELSAASFKPDVVVLSVGGGGLLSGVVEGLQRNGWSDVPVLAVETYGADSFAQSVESGYRVTLSAITTIATCLGAKQVCERAFELTKVHAIKPVLVTDRSAVVACEHFLADHRIVVEPACGASLALAYENSQELQGFEKVLIVACGGNAATVAQLQEWAKIAA